MMRYNPASAVGAIAVMAFFAGSAAQAELITFKADLSGAAQVPPVDSQATGTVQLTVDDQAKTVSWIVTAEGLSGEPSASHVHGPASPTEAAGPVIDTMAKMEGSAPITDEQIEAMKSAQYYYNVHTEKFPDGEIRGQLAIAK